MNQRGYLERGQRLSQSLLWRLQRSYYEEQGIAAWSQGVVPHYITSNPFIAHAYAQVVAAFIRDWAQSSRNDPAPFVDLGQPFYVVELGAGSGRFGYLFLLALQKLLAQEEQRGQVVYVMTDLVDANIDYWRNHPALQPFIAQGLLDFARFDVTQDDAFSLQISGRSLAADSLSNPLTLIANYVFDGIPQDVFFVDDGQVYDCLTALVAAEPSAEGSDPARAADLAGLSVLFEVSPTADVAYAGDPQLDRIVSDYAKQLDRGYIQMPGGVLQLCGRLRALSRDRMLLLVADKGYAHAVAHQAPPDVVFHGSASMLVNFHAIGEYVRHVGGAVLAPSHAHNRLAVAAFLFGQHPTNFVNTRRAFDEAVAQFGPDDFYMLVKAAEPGYAALSVAQILAWLRLSRWDAKIMGECLPRLTELAPAATEEQRVEMRRAVEAVWTHYFHIGEESDLAGGLGLLLVALDCFAEAVLYLEQSHSLFGPNPTIDFAAACSHFELGDVAQARTYAESVLAVMPAHDGARVLRSLLRTRGA